MKTETKAEFARRIGVHKSNITRAAQAGRLALDERGRVLIDASLKRWHETKGGRADVEARHAEQRGATVPQLQISQEVSSVGHAGADSALVVETGEARTRYKAIVLQFENAQIKLEMALRRGQRFPLESVRRESQGIGNTLRASVERLIDQTAPRLAVNCNPAERRRILEAETQKLRRIIKEAFPQALRRLRREAQGGKP
jgi:hypothetical protein